LVKNTLSEYKETTEETGSFKTSRMDIIFSAISKIKMDTTVTLVSVQISHS